MAWTPCCDEKVTPDGELSEMRNRLRLMLITDPVSPPEVLLGQVQAALRGGVTAVQVRRPGDSAQELYELVTALQPSTREAGALLIVNDRIDVALAAGADGVHLKGASLPPALARKLLGPHRVIGVSTHEGDEVASAAAGGADYAVFGPVFSTPSKAGVFEARGAERYRAVAAAAAIPVLALGGISRESLPALLPGPVPGVAVIRGLLGESDPEAAARELRRMLEECG